MQAAWTPRKRSRSAVSEHDVVHMVGGFLPATLAQHLALEHLSETRKSPARDAPFHWQSGSSECNSVWCEHDRFSRSVTTTSFIHTKPCVRKHGHQHALNQSDGHDQERAGGLFFSPRVRDAAREREARGFIITLCNEKRGELRRCCTMCRSATCFRTLTKTDQLPTPSTRLKHKASVPGHVFNPAPVSNPPSTLFLPLPQS